VFARRCAKYDWRQRQNARRQIRQDPRQKRERYTARPHGSNSLIEESGN
jgi:hypothetical protein